MKESERKKQLLDIMDVFNNIGCDITGDQDNLSVRLNTVTIIEMNFKYNPDNGKYILNDVDNLKEKICKRLLDLAESVKGTEQGDDTQSFFKEVDEISKIFKDTEWPITILKELLKGKDKSSSEKTHIKKALKVYENQIESLRFKLMNLAVEVDNFHNS